MSVEDCTVRYWLERDLLPLYGDQLYEAAPTGTLGFVMLNPSTADESADDPTIRRCIGFAKRERAARLVVANLFARRSTDPRGLWNETDEPSTDEVAGWLRLLHESDKVVAAWGGSSKPWLRQKIRARVARWRQVVIAYGGVEACALGYRKDESPRHPLYVKADAPLVPLGLRT